MSIFANIKCKLLAVNRSVWWNWCRGTYGYDPEFEDDDADSSVDEDDKESV